MDQAKKTYLGKSFDFKFVETRMTTSISSKTQRNYGWTNRLSQQVIDHKFNAMVIKKFTVVENHETL